MLFRRYTSVETTSPAHVQRIRPSHPHLYLRILRISMPVRRATYTGQGVGHIVEGPGPQIYWHESTSCCHAILQDRTRQTSSKIDSAKKESESYIKLAFTAESPHHRTQPCASISSEYVLAPSLQRPSRKGLL